TASKRWISLIETNQLENETSAYIEFANTILRDLLNYNIGIEELKHEEKNMEFLFKDKSGNNLVCFEAKGTKTKDLWAPQGRNVELRKTPVIQINSYMYNEKIPYGVLTNYREFVLFKREEGSSKFHKINFLDINNNPDKLKEFIFIFSKDSFEKEETNKLYNDSIIEERNLTKGFYKLYHETRLMILKEFKESGLENEKCLHYTQLFLNRLMFIFFAEDTNLLDKRYFRNKILEVLEKSGGIDNHTEYILGKIKSAFRELDKEIPEQIKGFNGELFKEEIDGRLSFKDYRNKSFFKDVFQDYKLDKELQLNESEKSIFNKHRNKISKIIENILLLASFDFKSEVNVNILGHIFEQSIQDIENLKEEKISKRKQEGIFYTPEYVTDYICRNTIIPYLSKSGTNDINELIDEYSRDIQELEKRFKSIKILDPACGSGAFLIKSTEILFEIFEKMQKLKQSYGGYDVDIWRKKKEQLTLKKWDEKDEIKNIIENNIYGVDINEESVEITKLSLFLKIARKNKKLIDLSNNIKKGNSLVDDETIDKNAFNWDKEFPFKFDVVVGNPPYVRADVDDENYKKQREWIIKNENYKTLYEKWDLYLAFIERGLSLSSDNGMFSMIIPDAFCTAKYALKMREYLSQNKQVNQIDYYPNTDIFEGVGVKNIILFIKNSTSSEKTKKIIHKDINGIEKTLKLDLKESGQDGFRLNYTIDKRFYEYSELLGDICFISKGMVLNSDEINYKGDFKKENLISDEKDEKHPREYIEAKNTQRYLIREKKFLEWGTDRVPKKISRKTFPELYQGEKIMRGRMTDAFYDDSGIVTNDSIYVLKKFTDLKNIKNKSIESSVRKNNNKSRAELEELSRNFNLKYVLTILNSKWAFNFLKNICRNRLSFYPDDLRKLLIRRISPEEQKPFIEKADFMIDKNRQFYEAKKKFIKLVRYKYNLDKTSRKLDTFYKLSFKEFVNEIQDKNKVISIEKEAELMDFFEKNKKDINKLVNEISETDVEIDKMVYNLYGITDKEQEIIKESLK
ncbi:MAG: DNA methyltransferase, partial [Nanoarchaeota archaeon]